MKLAYKRIHVPSGKLEIKEFNDIQLIPHFGSKNKYEKKLWVSEAENLIEKWNKLGIIDGNEVWKYELTVEWGKNE